MKILVISTSIFKVPVIGYSGLEQIAYLTAKGLAAKGHQVDIVAPEGSYCEGANIISIGPERSVDEKKAFKIYSNRLHTYDCIIDHSWQKWVMIAKMQGLKVPSLSVIHAPCNTCYQTLPPVENPCLVCISQDQADHFRALYGKEAKVCRNGCDPEFYKSIDIPRTDRFVFLARFSSIKGPDLAISACKEAGVGLDLIGDFSITNEPDLLKQCMSMCDGNQIKFIGPASRSEVVHWFSKAHCLLHPNVRFREPWGLSITEAQLTGCPVIAWDYGAMRENILTGVTGLLVDSYEGFVNAIRLATNKDSFFHSNRDKCRNWALQYSDQNMVNRYEELANQAVNGKGW